MSGLFRDARAASLTLGVGTVLVTHAAMLLNLLPGDWKDAQMRNHAYLNLAAAAAIVYGSGLV